VASVYADSCSLLSGRSLLPAANGLKCSASVHLLADTVWEIRLHSAVIIVVSVGAGGSFHSVTLLPPLSISLVQTR